MFLWCLFGADAVPSGGHCMEENVLMQMVSLQPNVRSRAGRFRRFRRFRRFGRFGAKTTSTESSTTQETTTSIETTTTMQETTTSIETTTTMQETTTSIETTTTMQETTTSIETTTTMQETTTSIESTTAMQETTATTTRVVCTGGTSGGSEVALTKIIDTSPPQNTFTFNVNVTSPECECVGSPVFWSIPGFLRVDVIGVQDANSVSFISITSPNDTDVKVAPFRSGTLLTAGTVAFNGFPANGSWVIKLLDASGNLSTQTGSTFTIQFGLISCRQVLPTPDCVGNSFGGRVWVAQNASLVGTTLSPSPTLLHFDVEASSACCVVSGFVQLRLEFNAVSSPSGRTLTAAGLSPDAIPFYLRTDLFDIYLRGTWVTRGVAHVAAFGGRAAGLWTLSTSTDGPYTAVINSLGWTPQLQVGVGDCP